MPPRRRRVRTPPPTESGTSRAAAAREMRSSSAGTGVERGADVQDRDLVGSLGRVAGGELDGIPGIHEVDEARSLHHPAAGDVEAGDDPLAQGHDSTAIASAGSIAPVRSARPTTAPSQPISLMRAQVVDRADATGGHQERAGERRAKL